MNSPKKRDFYRVTGIAVLIAACAGTVLSSNAASAQGYLSPDQAFVQPLGSMMHDQSDAKVSANLWRNDSQNYLCFDDGQSPVPYMVEQQSPQPQMQSPRFTGVAQWSGNRFRTNQPQYQGQDQSQYQGQDQSQYQGQDQSQYQGQDQSQYQPQYQSHEYPNYFSDQQNFRPHRRRQNFNRPFATNEPDFTRRRKKNNNMGFLEETTVDPSLRKPDRFVDNPQVGSDGVRHFANGKHFDLNKISIEKGVDIVKASNPNPYQQGINQRSLFNDFQPLTARGGASNKRSESQGNAIARGGLAGWQLNSNPFPIAQSANKPPKPFPLAQSANKPQRQSDLSVPLPMSLDSSADDSSGFSLPFSLGSDHY